MSRIVDLLKRLVESGIPVPKAIKDSMMNNDIEDFSDYDCEPFYSDRPIPFLETEKNSIKTISAPHMIVTLLHHLELDKGQEIVLIGSKGGYLSALIAQIIGEFGVVRVLDSCTDSIIHAKERLTHWPTIELRELESIEISPVAFPGEFNRVLITGHIEKLPEWITSRITDGGFVIAPLGLYSNQQLMKIERQGDELYPTELGPVCFGSIDSNEDTEQEISPIELADLIELSIETCQELDIINPDEVESLQDLIAELHFLPDEIPPLGDPNIPVSSHPIFKLLVEKSESLTRLWPVLQVILYPVLSKIGLESWIYDEIDELDRSDS
jgi:protein-L-isoaspartate(D-aspartate) O-methyltransferase